MWSNFPYIVALVALLWTFAAGLMIVGNSRRFNAVVRIAVYAGLGVLIYFIRDLWVHLERPPLRTLGETRLLYSLFMGVIGILLYERWKYRWLLLYSLGFSMMFMLLNIAVPEAQNKTLMPALHSPWFVPHVVVYIFSYALLGASWIVACKGLLEFYCGGLKQSSLAMADTMVYLGFGFLTLGLLFGALWAKEAWGDYWTWDPKETWAFITWSGYLIYIHVRRLKSVSPLVSLWVLFGAFLILALCWFGVQYLPSAQMSVHTYTN